MLRPHMARGDKQQSIECNRTRGDNSWHVRHRYGTLRSGCHAQSWTRYSTPLATV
jgi:hypothetical protein